VKLGHTRYWVDVRIRARRVTVYYKGRRVRTMRAVVGKASTPTPHGLAALYERNRQPDPRAFLGPWSLSLTVHSSVLKNFGGGPGRVAIHGRAGSSLRDPLGSARSHGCVRVTNGDVSWLARRLPPGTPVRLRR
jgi:lipoprotein-anchoring transpeptidase ErfK/SrfK